MLPDATFGAGEVTLQAGDRLVIVTDGMRERGAARLDLNAELLQVADLHPREAARALADAVLQVAGPVLADDATLVIASTTEPAYRHAMDAESSNRGCDGRRAAAGCR
jgi:serine phosphatase RsbU (regulator of sigma subunit)